MKKSNPIDVAFKDKAKFDTQSPIIGTLLTQIESGKTKNEKSIQNQLKGVLSIKDIMIAERLERLRESNRKNDNDNDDNDDDNHHPPSAPSSFVPPPYYPLSLSIDDEDSDIKNDLNLTQKFLLQDTRRQERIAVGKKTSAAVKKVRF